MKPGPPKKPTVLRLVSGNPSKAAVNRREPKPLILIPEPPDWLNKYAREEWDYVTPLLAKYKVISELDRAVLVSYVEAYADYRLARERLHAQGDALLVNAARADGTSWPMPNPYLSISNKAQRIMHGCLAELGLTPAARASLIAQDRIPGASISDDSDPLGILG